MLFSVKTDIITKLAIVFNCEKNKKIVIVISKKKIKDLIKCPIITN